MRLPYRFSPVRGATVLALTLGLGGCISGMPLGFGSKSPELSTGPEADRGRMALANGPERRVEGSRVIADLASRHSILPGNSHYAAIAHAVLAADAGAARSQLRVKKLTAEARSKNWLPTLGPSVSLTSLGSVVTSLLLEQTLFDFGRKKGEREYAVADVEVAAVSLSIDSNTRVAKALSLYIEAEAARARAAVAGGAMTRLHDFDRIMALRVQGGVSNMSEQTVLRQKLVEMDALLQADRDAETLAAAELDQLAAARMSSGRGLTPLPKQLPGVTPLAVHLAEAEKERTLAELKVARADNLPGLAVNKDLSRGGGIGGAIGLQNGLGLGTGATLEAIGAGAEAALARVAQSGRDAERARMALEMRIANLDRQEAAQQEVARQTRANLARFEQQYKAGVRPLMDLVSQHESLARMERDLASMRHERAKAQVEIARDLGLLAEGTGI